MPGSVLARVGAIGASIRVAWDHPANASSKASGVGRLVRYWVGSRILGADAVLVNREGIRLVVPRGAYGATRVFYGFPPDYDEMHLWSEVLREGDLFVDVGANIGLYSLWAASCGARVIAFEPSNDSWPNLMNNIALNPWSIDSYKAAVGNADGTAKMTEGRDAMNSLAPSAGGAGIVSVPMVSLDNAVEGPIRGLKIDVEGYEALVLDGASNLLETNSIDFVQIEWNGFGQQVSGATRNAVTILRDRGFTLFRCEDGQRVPITQALPPPGADIFGTRPGFVEDRASSR